MDWIDKECLDRTWASYSTALNKMLQLSGKNVKMRSGWGGNDGPLPTQFEIAWGAPVEDLRPHATNLFVNQASLFGDYGHGHATRFTGREWTWETDFFTVETALRFPFNIYGWEAGCTAGHDEEGNETVPAKSARIKEQGDYHYIGLRGPRKKWGLKDWKAKASEIAGWGAAMTPALAAEYSTQYAKACEMVARWEAEMVAVPRIPA